MNREKSAVSRRDFLKQSAAVGLGISRRPRQWIGLGGLQRARHHSQLKRHRHPQSLQS